MHAKSTGAGQQSASHAGHIETGSPHLGAALETKIGDDYTLAGGRPQAAVQQQQQRAQQVRRLHQQLAAVRRLRNASNADQRVKRVRWVQQAGMQEAWLSELDTAWVMLILLRQRSMCRPIGSRLWPCRLSLVMTATQQPTPTPGQQETLRDRRTQQKAADFHNATTMDRWERILRTIMNLF